MKKSTFIYTVLGIVMLAGFTSEAKAWGSWAHQRINRMAVSTLPPEMLHFFEANIEYLTEHAVDPDKRRYAVEGEVPRHYIDVGHFGVFPFETVPRKWEDAIEKYSEDTLLAHGIIPWHIQRQYSWLVEAFKAEDRARILKASAEIGHYVADSNVPLNTTENGSSQMVTQNELHTLWESRLPERFGYDYRYRVGHAQYFDNVLDEAWSWILESNMALEAVMRAEIIASEKVGSDQKYSFENRNNVLARVYSTEFCKLYHKELKGMVERKMRASILRVGSVWYSAWKDAGQPKLSKLLD